MPEVVAAPAAPAAAPAPAAPITQEGVFGVDNAIAEITRSAVEKTIIDGTPAEEQPRDAKGKFIPKGEQPAEVTPAATEPAKLESREDLRQTETQLEEEGLAPAAVELPEGYVLAPKVEGRELKTQFKVLDPSSGAELEVPELKIAFKANGRDREMTLDHVVKMAEWGFYNAERQEQFDRAESEARGIREQHEQILAYAKQLEADRDSLLSNDDYYLRHRAQYEHQNTPEARAQRATQEAQRATEQAQLSQVHAQGTQFYQSELLPAVATIAKALPHVSDEEIGAKLLLISDRFKARTQYGEYIPPQQYDAIRRAIVQDVVPWAQQLNDHRESDRAQYTKAETEKTKQAEAKARTAQIDAQKAKSMVGRQLQPGKRAPTGSSTQAKEIEKPIRTVEDAEQAAVRATLKAVMGG